MTVKELIDILKRQHPERLVVVALDADGKSHAPLIDWWAAAYKDGVVGLEGLGKIEKAAGFTDKNVLAGGTPALILLPGKR